ncbi:unnamed protein product [Arctia plantaginis]|uniref:Uncharacterized protein n=1 Tax=Arctia plantaginis TaxID=874455 RepID=A0A8S0YTB2_ARCPL|nr:unnamed protein product [Arctia plantaginis]
MVLVLLLVLLIVGVMLYMPLILGLVNTPHIIHTRDMRTDKKLKAINSIPSMLLNPFEYFFGINMSCEEIQDDTMPLLLDDEDPNSPEANAVPE